MSSKSTILLILFLMLTLTAGPVFAQRIVFSQNLNGSAGTADDEIGRNSFVVYEMNGTPPNSISGINVRTVTAKNETNGFSADSEGAFPNLKALFAFGGTVALVINFGDDGAGDSPDPDYTYANAEDVPEFKLVISEIMWGTDAAVQDPASVQWIEIYNEGAALSDDDDLRLVFYENVRTTDATVKLMTGFGSEVDYAIVDRVSTVSRFGAKWELKGSSGRSAADTANDIPESYLVSMYRKRSLNDTRDGYEYNAKGEPDGDTFKDGTDLDQWIASVGRTNIGSAFIGSPGSVQVAAGGLAEVIKDPDSLPATAVIINEIYNSPDTGDLDWIELHNTGSTDVTINGWELEAVHGTDDNRKQTTVANIPDEDYAEIPVGGYLVITNRHPSESRLIDGINIADDDAEPRGATHRYLVVSDMTDKMPNAGRFLLVLRSEAEDNHEKIVDIAGSLFLKEPNRTDVFPLQGWTVPEDREEDGDVEDADFGGDEFNAVDESFARIGDNNTRENRLHKGDWEVVGTRGGLGYDPNVDLAIAPGTPGYANDAVKTKSADVTGNIVISEIMYDAGANGRLAQWIELYNSSMTEAVDLSEWKLEIRNREVDDEFYVDASFKFKAGTIILPNQTLLLVSKRSSTNDVPNNRIYNLYLNHRTELELSNRESVLLSSVGFYLKLTDKDKNVVDEVGNVRVEGRRRHIVWTLPETDGEERYSILRRFGTRAFSGTRQPSWRKAQNASTYYGHRDDVGSPGHRLGSPLPVSLSSFRPVRDSTTDQVIITWITESELNNAGFNILRSESKDGEFTVINEQGHIPGHGTTSERCIYTYIDRTTKPNVVYYYRIEDISLDGKRTTLRTTHLRGSVTAAGKLTTVWGGLKVF